MDNTKQETIARWHAFLALEPHELDEQDPELLEKVEHAGNNADWIGGPVEALYPQFVEEFRLISKRLGALYNAKDEPGRLADYRHAPLLFRLGCDFGEAVEKVCDADASMEDRTDAMGKARGLWFALATLGPDSK